MSTTTKTGLGALLALENRVRLLADDQTAQSANLSSHEPTAFVGLANSANASGSRPVLTTGDRVAV